MKSSKKKRTVTTVGHGESEVKIYTLRNRAGYESFQCCWYHLGKRQTKTFGDRDAAALFAQQKTVEVANGIPEVTQATMRDIEIFKSCEKRVSAFGVALPIACEEWIGGQANTRGGPAGRGHPVLRPAQRRGRSPRSRCRMSFSSSVKPKRLRGYPMFISGSHAATSSDSRSSLGRCS